MNETCAVRYKCRNTVSGTALNNILSGNFETLSKYNSKYVLSIKRK